MPAAPAWCATQETSSWAFGRPWCFGQPWHPLSAPWPAVDLYLLCPPLTQWEPDPLRTMPSLEDRMALHRTYESALRHRPHLVVQGNTPEERLEHLLNEWPW